MPRPRKNGRPNTKEVERIVNLARTKTIEEIAEETGRRVGTIRGLVADRDELTDAQEIISAFRVRPEYKTFQKQFTPEELEVFEHKYVQIMRQFKKDTMYTEELQVFMLITYDILLAKNITKLKQSDDDINRISIEAEMLQAQIIEMSESQEKSDAIIRLRGMNEFASQLRLNQARLDKTIQDYTEKMLKQWELIKGTRKDRIQIIENSKKTFFDMLKSFEDTKFRENEGREMELMKIAGEREKLRLAEPHKYMDGSIDRPLLNGDTVGEEPVEERVLELDSLEKDRLSILEEQGDETNESS